MLKTQLCFGTFFPLKVIIFSKSIDRQKEFSTKVYLEILRKIALLSHAEEHANVVAFPVFQTVAEQ